MAAVGLLHGQFAVAHCHPPDLCGLCREDTSDLNSSQLNSSQLN